MNRLTRLTALIVTSCMAVSAPVLAQTAQDEQRFEAAQRRFQNELQLFQAEYDRYRQARARNDYRGPQSRDPRYDQSRYDDPRYGDRYEGGYDAARYYRDGPNYKEHVLAADERVYRGNDGRYYCKRNDGTTGLIIGAVGGGILGNVIDGGHSRAAGTLIGGAIGALVGKSIDQNSQEIRCR